MKILNKEIKDKKKGFEKIPNSILRAKDLSHVEFRILVILCDYSNGFRFNKTSLAERCSMSEKTVRRNFTTLEEKGWLEVVGFNCTIKDGLSVRKLNGLKVHPKTDSLSDETDLKSDPSYTDLIDEDLTDTYTKKNEVEVIELLSPYHRSMKNN